MDFKVEQQRDHFNSIAQRYGEGREDPNHKRIKHLIWNESLRCLDRLRGRKVVMLEPMCGYAEGLQIATSIAELDCEYHGFDYSDVIVADLLRAGIKGEIWQADATVFLPEARRYDLIFLAGGLHHIPDHAAAVVQRLATGMRPGAMFVSFEPTHGNPLFKAIRDRIYRRNEIFDEGTERAFAVDQYLQFFHDAGLEQVHVSYPGLAAYVLYYNTYAFPFFNRGNTKTVDRVFSVDRIFMDRWLGRVLSFATVSVWKMPE